MKKSVLSSSSSKPTKYIIASIKIPIEISQNGNHTILNTRYDIEFNMCEEKDLPLEKKDDENCLFGNRCGCWFLSFVCDAVHARIISGYLLSCRIGPEVSLPSLYSSFQCSYSMFLFLELFRDYLGLLTVLLDSFVTRNSLYIIPFYKDSYN